MKKKLLIIGLDGATFKVLKPLIRKGYLPTLKKLIKNGVSGNLKSTIPPTTAPAWLSFATGKNPGKTGVFDFFNRKDDRDYKLYPADSSAYKNESYFDILSRKGLKVGIINYPTLFPAYKINGFMVSGMPAPDKHRFAFWPRSLGKKIEEICQGYQIMVEPKNYPDPSALLRIMKKLVAKRLVLSEKLAPKCDIYTVVFSATDFVSHFLWKYLDKTHPLYQQSRAFKYRPEINNFYQKIDEAILKIINSYPYQPNIIIMSDHGFGKQKGTFAVNLWLKKNGYLKTKKARVNKSGIKIKLSRQAQNLIKKMPARLSFIKKILPRNLRFKLGRNITFAAAGDPKNFIDFKKSTAFALGHTHPFSSIYLQDKSVKNELISQIKKELKKYGAEIKFYSREKIYQGPKKNLAPDLIFSLNNWAGQVDVLKLSGKKVYQNKETDWSGAHRREGIFIASGPDIKKKARIKGARIIDLCPTILAFFNCPIPDNLDGRVLKKIFKNKKEKIKTKKSEELLGIKV